MKLCGLVIADHVDKRQQRKLDKNKEENKEQLH
jgi:hypothetical protein